MKKTLLILLPLALVSVLVGYGNRLIGKTLDAQLPPLLTDVLGLPVTIAPINASVLQLTAGTAELVMGDASNPAVLAHDLQVKVSLSALLEGELRFDFANATELSVKPAQWPASEGESSPDYLFLEQWLPTSMAVEHGQYLPDEGAPYSVQTATWERLPDGRARIGWREARGFGTAEVALTVASLMDTLRVQPTTLAASIEVEDSPDSAVTAQIGIEPGSGGGYELLMQLSAAGLEASIDASGDSAWTIPGKSLTRISTLQVDEVISLVNHYRTTPAKAEPWLDNLLPTPALADHAGRVEITELRVGDGRGEDTAFNFTVGAQGVSVQSLTSTGPEGKLAGELTAMLTDGGWQVSAEAAITAHSDNGGLASQFVQSQWRWRSGDVQLQTQGNTWEQLLYALTGQVSLGGYHLDVERTPIAITGRLGTEPNTLVISPLSVAVGGGLIDGAVRLYEGDRRTLEATLTGSNINLDFLFDADSEQTTTEVGISLPEYLRLFPQLDVVVEIDANNLKLPGLSVPELKSTLQRHELGGSFALALRGSEGGAVSAVLDASAPRNEPAELTLNVDFKRTDLPRLFRQDGLFFSRSTGSLTFGGSGHTMQAIFSSMRGSADIAMEFRADNNWARPTGDRERLNFTGDASLVLSGKRIVGLELSELDLVSLEQDLNGRASIVAGRTPWLVADLESSKLDIGRIMDLVPESAEAADDGGTLDTLRELGAARATLHADQLLIGGAHLEDLALELESAPQRIDIKQLDFGAEGARVLSNGKITWKGQVASLESAATLENVDLDQFIIVNTERPHVPVSGSFKLQSEGRSVADLLANAQGFADLGATDTTDTRIANRRTLAMQINRKPDGMLATIQQLEWGSTHLAGSVRMHNSSPPRWEVAIDSGALSLTPWEALPTATATPTKEAEGSALGAVARTSASVVGNLLRAPLRLLENDAKQASAQGGKIFSPEPLPLTALQGYNLSIHGRLDLLDSSVLRAKELKFNADLTDGLLNVAATSGDMNGGPASLDLTLNSAAVPPSIELVSTFDNVRGLAGGETYPRSGHISLSSSGNSPALFAANASGLVYLRAGRGPFDYANSSLLTADIATSVFRNLVPGIEEEEPTLRCAVAAFVALDGLVATPFGYAARTNRANLLGRVELDLREEEMLMKLDSRSREGVGISVGSVFSNTIEVRGSLSDPRIVPNTTGLLWRGWAAVMTAGLSIVGESVIKRAMASENPCESLGALIEKELCPVNDRAAASSMVCPSGA